MKKFETGKTYSCRSVCDYNCIFKYEIVSRSEKMIKIKNEYGKIRSCKINLKYDENEYIYPEGRYSMCPVLRA